ncbi:MULTISPECIES: hypothetical protein [unclassified Kitasatospora]|uniref:hypothetical protein n=1 Tax=unclassified Kitasatospora TaxID=2633591 RepID=UPI00070CB484|nr:MULTISPECIES: hypothetical protein [unclassified Kitasatospora]KQV20932.1 hypothetical protein ASC99_20730 [Kitasatospora sp. Root107]KRB60414.1 hypothetical protein ASE03_12450 [Kitasatospora sp. Root187]
MTQLASVLTLIAENLARPAKMPERPGLLTSGAAAEECENARTVLRHCTRRISDLTASTTGEDPHRLAAVAAFRVTRVHAAALHRQLAHALHLSVVLEDRPLPAKDDTEGAERERRLVYQALFAVAEAQNAGIAAAREALALADQLPPVAVPRAPAARRSRTTTVASRPAAGPPLVTASGRRR